MSSDPEESKLQHHQKLKHPHIPKEIRGRLNFARFHGETQTGGKWFHGPFKSTLYEIDDEEAESKSSDESKGNTNKLVKVLQFTANDLEIVNYHHSPTGTFSHQNCCLRVSNSALQPRSFSVTG